MEKKYSRSAGGSLLFKVLDFVEKADNGYILSEYGKNNPYDQKELLKIFSDEDTVKCCFCLFDNNLNVSLTAGQLYMHRNTLIYRINKIKRLTGLDVHKFSDAVTFTILYGAYQNRG